MEFRRPVGADAAAIAVIIESVWPEESAEIDTIRYAITQPDHATIIAEHDDQIVGFLDAFSTVAANRKRRWEIDLLAVLPGFQGRHVGRNLITLATKAGRQRGHDLARARALVHVANGASQRVFAECGYQISAETYRLIIAGPTAPALPTAPDNLNLIPVNSCRYRGLWLEQSLCEAGFGAARATQLAGGYETVGAIIADHIIPGAGWLTIGRYHWCTLTY
jgi:ribosomal protein S18 acetylase RimI-like enzyme